MKDDDLLLHIEEFELQSSKLRRRKNNKEIKRYEEVKNLMNT
jgi:hypothetical protein